MITMSVSIKLSSNIVRISLGKSIKSHCPVVKGRSRWNMSNHVNKLIFSLRFFQLSFNPFKHLTWVCRISKIIPVLIILSLCIDRNNFKIVKLRDSYTEISFCSKHFICLWRQPRFPSLCQTTNKHFLPISFIIINVNREAFMVTHSCNYSCICRLFQEFA